MKKFFNRNSSSYFRKTTGGTKTASRSVAGGGAGNAGMWRFYTEDSPGLKV